MYRDTVHIKLTHSETVYICLRWSKRRCFICVLVCLLWQARLFMTWINNMSSKANLFEAGSSIEWMLIDIYCMGRSDTIMLGVRFGYGMRFTVPRVGKLEINIPFYTLDCRDCLRSNIFTTMWKYKEAMSAWWWEHVCVQTHFSRKFHSLVVYEIKHISIYITITSITAINYMLFLVALLYAMCC